MLDLLLAQVKKKKKIIVFVSRYPAVLYSNSMVEEEPEQTTGEAVRCLDYGSCRVRKLVLAFNQCCWLCGALWGSSLASSAS